MLHNFDLELSILVEQIALIFYLFMCNGNGTKLGLELD
jgi:hypothetical protein